MLGMLVIAEPKNIQIFLLGVHNFLQRSEMQPLAKMALVRLAFPINAHQNANQ